MRNYKKVNINGEGYPIRCNIRVLGEIQEVYGSVRQFELDLIGGESRKDENGKTSVVITREKSWSAVAKVLPLMVNEGCLLTGKELLDPDVIIDGLETDVHTVARLMREEYTECFKRKK